MADFDARASQASVLHLCCASDARYVPHTAAMLHSVLSHSSGAGVHVHYLCGPDFPRVEGQRLEQMVRANDGEISFVTIADELVEGLPTIEPHTAPAGESLSSPMWYRIFLPDLLPDVDRILYLDGDTIACDSLAPLWTTDLEGAYLGAVSNVFQDDHLGHLTALGYDDPRDYFNSGVLLLNLELMRRDGCTQALLEYAKGHRHELVWPDQDTLNVVLGRRRRALHPRWNCMNSMFRYPWSMYVFGAEALACARESPGIRHFEGPTLNKPWHYDSWCRTRDAYFAHRRATPWPTVELEGRTLRARTIHTYRRARRAPRGLMRRLRAPVNV
jgi:lipopolysaccharide biosynthesis glycosyltransferase